MYPQIKLHMVGKFDEFHDKLVKRSELEYRVKISIEALKDIVPICVSCECKDSSVSNNLIEEANKFSLKQKDNTVGLLQAWEFYSKSIAFAQNDSKELPIAYANRSAVLYNLNKYTESIIDIDTALKLCYPNEFRTKLLRRKVKCLKLLDQEVEDKCKEVKCMFESIQLDDKCEKNLESQIYDIENFAETKKLKKCNSRIFRTNFERNSKIPCASSAISIKYDRNYGRCVVATRDIRVGEILVIEKPYAALLKRDYLYSHCSHCFKRAWNGIPCTNCVHAMYCSENCKSEAWVQYHDVECPIKAYLLSMSMNDLALFSLKVAILAIRQAGSISKLRQQLYNIDKDEGYLKKSFSEDGLYHSDQYRAIHLLESHENKRLPHEYITISINTAVILYFVNSLTSFLGNNSDKSIEVLSKNENAIFLGKLIIKHYMSIQMNNHEITEADYTGDNHGLGSAVFSFCSLFNHNCNPNATRIPVIGEDNNLQLVIIALHPIDKDTQVFDDYGYDFTMKSYSERRKHCLQYHFTCKCTACLKKWSSSKNDLPSITMFYSPPKWKNVEMIQVLDTLQSYINIFYNKDIKSLDAQPKKVLRELSYLVNMLFKYSGSPPLREFFDAVLLFRHAFIVIHGNRYIL